MPDMEDLPRPRQVVVSLSLLVLWLVTAALAVGSVVGFAHSLRDGLEALGGLGVVLGVTRLVTESGGVPTWPTRIGLQRVWHALKGTPRKSIESDERDVLRGP